MSNWYYVWDEELVRELIGEDESNIAWLCETCAEELGEAVSFASSDSLCGQKCWRCFLYPDDGEDDEALMFPNDVDNPDDRP